VLIPVGAVALIQLLNFRFKDFPRVVWRPMAAGVTMVVVVRLFQAAAVENHVVRLALEVSTGAVVFLGVLVALWWLSGRPDGVEKMAIEAVASRIRLHRKE
jgi:hypothetical protein